MVRPSPKDMLALRAPAKVNLHLGVYPGRDGRGYHRVDSVMIALELADELSVSRAEAAGASFSPHLGIDGEKTAAHKAIRAFEATFTPWCSYHADITRHIPSAAGLGSSSTDAAAVLCAAAKLNDIPTDDPRLIQIACTLGADVAFFLQANPALFVGAGDVHSRSFPQLRMPIVLVKPEAGVSTVEAYGVFDEDPTFPPAPESMMQALLNSDVPAIAASLYNNLAPAAMKLAPEIGECVAWLSGQEGVLAAQVAGSGSCSFAICEGDGAAERIADASPWWACATRTCASDERISNE